LTSRGKVDFGSLGPSVYLPSLLFGIGQGAILPVIPLTARDLGASVATASLVVGMLGVGRVIGDLPAGQLAMRIGERRAMLVALGLVIVSMTVSLLAPSVLALAGATMVVGLALAVFALARHAYIAETVPYESRGRSLSTLGGTIRIGLFAGPFLGAAVMTWLGTDGGYWVFLVVAVVDIVVLLVVPDLPPLPAASIGRPDEQRRDSLRRVIRRNLPVLRTLGVAAAMVGAVRAARQVAIPLWGDHIGLEPATTTLIFGIAGAVDMLLFYPAGLAMDRLGRRWVAIPSMLVLGASLVVLPLTHSPAAFTAAAMLTGLGNGLGSGIMMTIGADVSPPVSRAAFLGAWRLCADLGDGGGPLVISAVAAVATLGVALMAAGAFGGLAALLMARWLPRRTP
jgi:MFS family permease